MLWEVDVYPAPGQPDLLGQSATTAAAELGLAAGLRVSAARGYLIQAGWDRAQAERVARELLVDSVVEQAVVAPVGDEALNHPPMGWGKLAGASVAERIANALQPAQVDEVILCQMLGRAIVLVREDQLSLAIGRRGQNVRFASKHCGWDIEIITRDELDVQIEQAVAGFSALEGIERNLAEKLVGEGFLSYDDLSVIEPDALMEMGGLSAEQVQVIVQQAEAKAEEAKKATAEQRRHRREREGAEGKAEDAAVAGPTGAVALSTRILIHVLPKPGVMDPVAQSVMSAIEDFGLKAEVVRTLKKYWVRGTARRRHRRAQRQSAGQRRHRAGDCRAADLPAPRCRLALQLLPDHRAHPHDGR